MDAQSLTTHGLAAKILLSIEDARAGNPYPLMEILWGKIFRADDVVADPTILQRHHGRYLVLDNFQLDAISAVFDPSIREVYIKGNTGCGKGACIGLTACLYYAIWPDAQVVLTRDSHKSAVNIVFGEIAQWWRRMSFTPKGCVLQSSSIIDQANRERHFIRVATPETDEGFSGMHGQHVLFIFDEATAPVLNARFALADTQCSKFLAVANPRTTSGKFREAFQGTEDPDVSQVIPCRMGRRKLITVDGADCLNVRAKRLKHPVAPPGGITIGERRYAGGDVIEDADFANARSIIPGQTCFDEYLGLCAHPDPGWVRCFAHGRFMDEDPERQLMFSKWLRPCQDLWKRWNTTWTRTERRHNQASLRKRLDRVLPVTCFGFDVAGSENGDAAVLTAGGEKGIRRQHHIHESKAPAMVQAVIALVEREYGLKLTSGEYPICVDMDGLGWGVGGLLQERGCRVIEFRGNGSSDVDPKKYANKRAEAYGEFAERVKPDGKWEGIPFYLPDCDLLRQELVAPKKIYKGADGLQFRITPKRPVPGSEKETETIQGIIGRSPDRGDSAVYWHRALMHVGKSLDQWLDKGFF